MIELQFFTREFAQTVTFKSDVLNFDELTGAKNTGVVAGGETWVAGFNLTLMTKENSSIDDFDVPFDRNAYSVDELIAYAINSGNTVGLQMLDSEQPGVDSVNPFVIVGISGR